MITKIILLFFFQLWNFIKFKDNWLIFAFYIRLIKISSIIRKLDTVIQKIVLSQLEFKIISTFLNIFKENNFYFFYFYLIMLDNLFEFTI